MMGGMDDVFNRHLPLFLLYRGGRPELTDFAIFSSATDANSEGNIVERRYELQLERMLAQAEGAPELTEGLLERLDRFVVQFTAALVEPEQRRHAVEYITGLLSRLEHKTSEGIASLH